MEHKYSKIHHQSVGHLLMELFGKSCHSRRVLDFCYVQQLQPDVTHKWISLGASWETPPFGDNHMNFSCDDTEKEAMTQKKTPAEIVA